MLAAASTSIRITQHATACVSSDGGIVKAQGFDVLRLIANSNFVGCSTGRSPGFVPLRIPVNVQLSVDTGSTGSYVVRE